VEPEVEAENRRFFLPEKKVEEHGRKTWLDHILEIDPSAMKVQVAANYQEAPPARIAVLPFIDRGSANFVVNKIPIGLRNAQEREQWAWTHANRLRRSMTGSLAQREFTVVNMMAIDAVLAAHGINDWSRLQAVPVKDLGCWFGADTVVYGEVLHYEAYYALLVAAWQVGVRVRMVSTVDGHEVFSANFSRYAVDLRPSLDPMDIALNSVLALLQLRDVTLARAEEEVTREISLRLPTSKRNIEDPVWSLAAYHPTSGSQCAEQASHLIMAQPHPASQNPVQVAAPASGVPASAAIAKTAPANPSVAKSASVAKARSGSHSLSTAQVGSASKKRVTSLHSSHIPTTSPHPSHVPVHSHRVFQAPAASSAPPVPTKISLDIPSR
jgi:hypothetical protein